MFQAIRTREAEITALDSHIATLDEPIAERLSIIPTWVRKQLEDAAGLLSDTPERAKAEFQRLDIRFTVHPVLDEGRRPFLRAEGTGRFEYLTFGGFTNFTTTD